MACRLALLRLRSSAASVRNRSGACCGEVGEKSKLLAGRPEISNRLFCTYLARNSSALADSFNCALGAGLLANMQRRQFSACHGVSGICKMGRNVVPTSMSELQTSLSELHDTSIQERQVSDLADPQMQVGKHITVAEKRQFLINTLFHLQNSKEAVYGTLDAWVAWEPTFPLSSLKKALVVLEKEQQWHRIVQVLKWILSKGQGTTMGTYEQLIRALEKDNRADEAHEIWKRKISHDLHSVPWNFCELMLSIYYRNNMLERLVKLFRALEAYDRKPPRKSIVQKVADAYEMLGQTEEKSELLVRYSYLYDAPPEKRRGKLRKAKKAAGNKKHDDGNKVLPEDSQYDSGPSDEELCSEDLQYDSGPSVKELCTDRPA